MPLQKILQRDVFTVMNKVAVAHGPLVGRNKHEEVNQILYIRRPYDYVHPPEQQFPLHDRFGKR
jgi:hypothetical protein